MPRSPGPYNRIAQGERFGSLVVGEPVESRRGAWYYAARCDCGRDVVTRGDGLRNGKAKSCGCARGRNRRGRPRPNVYVRTTDGHASRQSPTYISWRAMLARCRNPRHMRYKDYGGRGVLVCARWQGTDGFLNFLADVGERPTGKTLDRIDTNGNYEPGNCRWATATEQQANKRGARGA